MFEAHAPTAIAAAAAAVGTPCPYTTPNFAAVSAVPRLPAVAAEAAAAAEAEPSAAAARPAPGVSGADNHRWIPDKNASRDSRPAMQPAAH